MKKFALVAFGVVFGTVLLVLGLTYYGHKTLPNRLTASVKEVAVNKDIFTRSKLVEYHEEVIWVNINGDGSIEGTFQLSKEEIEILLSSDSLIKCPVRKSCELKKSDRYSTANVSGGTLYAINIDSVKNQVRWTVTWY